MAPCCPAGFWNCRPSSSAAMARTTSGLKETITRSLANSCGEQGGREGRKLAGQQQQAPSVELPRCAAGGRQKRGADGRRAGTRTAALTACGGDAPIDRALTFTIGPKLPASAAEAHSASTTRQQAPGLRRCVMPPELAMCRAPRGRPAPLPLPLPLRVREALLQPAYSALWLHARWQAEV